MKYLKQFANQSDYQAFKESEDYILPNVSFVEDGNLYYNPKVFIKTNDAGDIAYVNGNNVYTISPDDWDVSLGTPIGIVVVPQDFAHDGKTRIIGLNYVNYSGNPSQIPSNMRWKSGTTVDTNLTNYKNVPYKNNSYGVDGYLPADKFTGTQSSDDSEAKYYGSTESIPSPYLSDEPNPEYYKEISGNNALSDFNGLSNTEYLVSLGSHVAANSAWKYTDAASNLQWYLPAMGELGYLMSRINKINSSISAVGGVVVDDYSYWSSTEYDKTYAYSVNSNNGRVRSDNKISELAVRPFAVLS